MVVGSCAAVFASSQVIDFELFVGFAVWILNSLGFDIGICWVLAVKRWFALRANAHSCDETEQ
jgi:hypothetical protein